MLRNVLGIKGKTDLFFFILSEASKKDYWNLFLGKGGELGWGQKPETSK